MVNLSYMAQTERNSASKTSKSSKAKPRVAKVDEQDSAYFLKLVLYVIVGAQWLRITTASGTELPIPVGLLVGLLFASHEHFQVDRKIEYAILLVATMIGFFAQIGLFASI